MRAEITTFPHFSVPLLSSFCSFLLHLILLLFLPFFFSLWLSSPLSFFLLLSGLLSCKGAFLKPLPHTYSDLSYRSTPANTCMHIHPRTHTVCKLHHACNEGRALKHNWAFADTHILVHTVTHTAAATCTSAHTISYS